MPTSENGASSLKTKDQADTASAFAAFLGKQSAAPQPSADTVTSRSPTRSLFQESEQLSPEQIAMMGQTNPPLLQSAQLTSQPTFLSGINVNASPAENTAPANLPATSLPAPSVPGDQSAQNIQPPLSPQGSQSVEAHPSQLFGTAKQAVSPQNASQTTDTLVKSDSTTVSQAATLNNAPASPKTTTTSNGASFEFLQSMKAGGAAANTSNAGATGTATITATAIAQTSAAQTSPTSTNATSFLQTSDMMMSDASVDLMLDGDLQDGMDTTFKDVANVNTKQAEMPPSLRNTNTVAQQAWSGIIHRFDGKAQKFEIRLDPAELGKVDVSIEITKDNKAQVVLAARSAEALAELNRGAKALELALNESGLDLAEDGLSFEMYENDSSSFTFSEENDPDDPMQGDVGQDMSNGVNDENTEQQVRQISPQLTTWSRPSLNLTA